MTVTRTHKAYMRGGIWLLALIVLVMLPGFESSETASVPVEVASAS